jgi:hypothetical protein
VPRNDRPGSLKSRSNQHEARGHDTCPYYDLCLPNTDQPSRGDLLRTPAAGPPAPTATPDCRQLPAPTRYTRDGLRVLETPTDDRTRDRFSMPHRWEQPRGVSTGLTRFEAFAGMNDGQRHGQLLVDRWSFTGPRHSRTGTVLTTLRQPRRRCQLRRARAGQTGDGLRVARFELGGGWAVMLHHCALECEV